MTRPEAGPADAVAIVGAACRLGAVEGPDDYWAALAAGRELIAALPAGPDPAGTGTGPVVRAGAVLPSPTHFDAAFFGISPREAELTDPQQRLFLECCWHALEDAGRDPARSGGDIGVFGGCGENTYLPLIRRSPGGWADNPMAVGLGNEKDFVATRVAFRLGLTGPAVAVQTACSTSLVAVHLACQSLLDYECDLALAGGSSVAVDRADGYPYQPEGILSPDGHCRPFDRRAAGTVPGDGVAAVVLRRLEDALADGDEILAVVRGSAIRNDGRDKVGFSAPGVGGQVAALRAAYEAAGLDPATVDLVEAHGTGTALGDPIEVAALAAVLGGGRTPEDPCVIGAVKSALGHTDTAAGVAGLLAAVGALRRRVLPGVLHFEQPHPHLPLTGGLRPLATPRPWPPRDHPRRAAVNSLGIGGTNAHVVLEEAPARGPHRTPAGWQVVPLSAATPTALRHVGVRLRERLADRPDLDPADVAHTLQAGRAALRYRSAVVAPDLPGLVARLDAATADPAGDGSGAPARVRLLFPGGGAQRADMAEGLYRDLPVFRREVDELVRRLAPGFDEALLDWVGHDLAADRAAAWAERPEHALPALFLVERAMAGALLALGLRPDAVIGHSLGEYTAACLAGVLTPEDAYAVVAERGRLLGAVPGGGMLSVPLPEAEVARLLGDDLDLAAVNGPGQCVLTGPAAALRSLRDRLAADGVEATPLPLAAAAHSRAVEPYLDRFGEVLAGVTLSAPSLRFVSNETGDWADPAEVVTPAYWVRHLRDTVRFGAGLATLVADRVPAVLIEAGPGTTLSALARRAADPDVVTARSASTHPDDPRPDAEAFLGAVAAAWTRGAEVDWAVLHAHRGPRRVRLPGYPFERTPHDVRRSRPASSPPAAGPRPGVRVAAQSWRRLPAGAGRATPPDPGARWLVVDPRPEAELADAVAHGLAAAGRDVRVVDPATAARLLAGGGAVEVVDTAAHGAVRSGSLLDRYRGTVEDVAGLGRVLAGRPPGSVSYTVLGSHFFDVTGSDPVDPARAPWLALRTVLPAECGARTRLWDIGPARRDGVAAEVVGALLAGSRPDEAALRGTRWWGRETTAVPLDATGTVLPDRPVVLVTGGLTGAGARIAEQLAATRRARLVLVSRSGVDGPGADERRGTVRRIEAAGGEVLVVTGDVARGEQVRAAVRAAVDRFGGLHAVVHSAAVPYGAVLERREPAPAGAGHAPKAGGAVALLEAVSELPRVTVLLMSSATVGGGAIGSYDYAAANAFLDALASRSVLPRGGRVVSVAWGRWSGTGMSRALEERHEALTGERVHDGMDPAAAAAAVETCLGLAAGGEPLLTVVPDAPGPVHAPREPSGERPPAAPTGDPPAAGERRHRRPAQLGPVEDPDGDLERQLAGVWAEALNLDQVGAVDNFLELGGDSLIGIQIVRRLVEVLDRPVPLRLLFARPTVRSMAAALAQEARTTVAGGSGTIRPAARTAVADLRAARDRAPR